MLRERALTQVNALIFRKYGVCVRGEGGGRGRAFFGACLFRTRT